MSEDFGIMVCGHGSRDENAVREFAVVAEAMRERFPEREVEYGFLGVRPGNASSLDMQGLLSKRRMAGAAVILDVIRNSPAELDGLRPNDLILEVNDQVITNQYDLMREIAFNGPWDPESSNVARVRVWRPIDRREFTLKIRPGKWPVLDVGISTSSRFPKWHGITVDYNTARSKYMSRTSNSSLHKAVLVAPPRSDRSAVSEPG